jgi:nicotinate-nucleotide pyrophosphorylase (carboxylating)
VRFESILADGSKMSPGQVLARVQGPARSILAAERLYLNFLQRLSGIASLTRAYVEAVRGTDAHIFDTRKTTPLWRSAEKYAVLIGGGFNHRLALESAVLLKDNHLRLVSPPGDSQPLIRLIKKIRARIPDGMTIEVEVEDLRTLRAVLSSPLDIIMLDNMTPSQMRRAVSMVHEARGREVEVEASGNVTLRNIRRIARTGVDRIAVGAITHSVQALDISLEVEPASKS